jgi:hypothetical protein
MTETTNPEIDNIPEDLGSFKELLFKGKTPEPVEVEDIGETVDAPANEDETQTELPLDTPDASPKEEPVEKKKQTLQERIDEITAKRREAERVAEQERSEKLALLERIKELEARTTQATTPKETPAAADNGPPDPLAKLEDGEDKYPLGEFDPNFIKDLTRYEFQRLMADKQKEEQQAAVQSEEEKARLELVNNWNQKLVEARDTKYPDFEEKAATIQIEFADLDPAYGDYLASTIMSLENGDDVLYYLADNIDEAKAIAKSGGVAATVALGRLSARLEAPKAPTKPTVKTTKAPEPPPIVNKGASTSDVIRADTEDLEAFKQLLWPNSKRK